MIKIEGGCIQIRENPSTWRYNLYTTKGFKEYVFISPEGIVPEVGDSILDGVLVKREGIQVNPDAHLWIKKEKEYWDE